VAIAETIPAPPPRPIPDGEPAAVAAELADSLLPIGQHAAARLAVLASDIAQAVEHARQADINDHQQALSTVITRLGRLVLQRATLAGRPADTVGREVVELLGTVGRWQNGQELASLAAAWTAGAECQLADCEDQLQKTIAFPPYAADPLARHAFLKDRLAELLAVRRDLKVRLERLQVGDPATMVSDKIQTRRQ
jgi:hypothetical protein